MDTLLLEKQIIDLNDYLSLLLPGSTISVEAITFSTGISRTIIEEVLIILSDLKLLDTLFVLKCNNENFDFSHTYTFTSYENLIEFVKFNNTTCPECDSDFLENNTEVFFLIPPNNLKKVF